MVVKAIVVICLFQLISELTSEDETLTRHVFFLDFNDEYQNLTKYSLIQQLNLPQLTAKELEELPNRLTALQPMTLNHLKEQIKPLTIEISLQCTPECCTNYSNGITTTNAC